MLHVAFFIYCFFTLTARAPVAHELRCVGVIHSCGRSNHRASGDVDLLPGLINYNHILSGVSSSVQKTRHRPGQSISDRAEVTLDDQIFVRLEIPADRVVSLSAPLSDLHLPRFSRIDLGVGQGHYRLAAVEVVLDGVHYRGDLFFLQGVWQEPR